MGNEKEGTIVLKTMWSGADAFHGDGVRIEMVDPGDAVRLRNVSNHVRSGFNDLEERMGGFGGGDLVVVASDVARLNSSFAVSLAQKVCVSGGHPVLYFSPGREASVLFSELLVNCGRLNGGWRFGRLADEAGRYEEARQALEKAALFVNDLPDILLEEIFVATGRAVERHGVRMAIVDHADFIRVRGGSYFGSGDAEEIAKDLKLLARMRNIPVVLLAPTGELYGSAPCPSVLGKYSSVCSYADSIVFLKDVNESRPGEVDACVIRKCGGVGGVARLVYIEHLYRLEEMAGFLEAE